jgi:hypothetical protein
MREYNNSQTNNTKILSLSPLPEGKVRIYASNNLTKKEKLHLLTSAIKYLEEEDEVMV